MSKLFINIPGLDERSAKFLAKALSGNNLAGFDYLEFKESITNLSAMNLDEQTAIKTAFATASTMGLTKQKLLDTAAHYKTVLQKEKGQFDAALKNRIQKSIGAREEANKQYESRLEQIEVQFRKLKEEIEQLNAKIDENKKIKEEEKSKLRAQKENFDTTYDLFQQEIDKDVDKISSYL